MNFYKNIAAPCSRAVRIMKSSFFNTKTEESKLYLRTKANWEFNYKQALILKCLQAPVSQYKICKKIGFRMTTISINFITLPSALVNLPTWRY